MELRRYGVLILRWWWLLVLATLLAGSSGYAVSSLSPKVYRATTTLLVNQAQNASGGLDYNSILMSERLTRTYADLAKKAPTLNATIAKLGLPDDLARLERAVTVRVVRDTQLLEIAVEDESPELAQRIADTLAKTFIEQRAADQTGQTSTARTALQRQTVEVEADMRATAAALEKAKAAPDQPEANRLQGLLAQQQATYAQLLRNEADFAIAETRSTNSLKIAVPAELPLKPVRPNVPQNTALAAVVGLLLALGGIFLIEYLDDTVKSEADVQASVGLATLAVVPHAHKKREKGEQKPLRLDAHDAHSILGESYRLLRVNVDFAWAGSPGRSILFTSANPGEGKSSTVANLALSFAQDGRRVVVLDADMRKPSAHRAFDLRNEHGLSNLLADPSALPERFLQKTDLPGLQVLTAGPVPPNPAELLGSTRFGQVLASLAKAADVILVDSPPVLGLVDPTVISARVDGVILVTEAAATRVESLGRAVDAIERAGARRLGVVLNKVTSGAGTYGYYNYYRTGYYYRRDGDPANGTANGTGRVALNGSVAHGEAVVPNGRE